MTLNMLFGAHQHRNTIQTKQKYRECKQVVTVLPVLLAEPDSGRGNTLHYFGAQKWHSRYLVYICCKDAVQ